MAKVYYAIEGDSSSQCFLSMSLDLNVVLSAVEDFKWRSGEKWSDVARMTGYYEEAAPHLDGVLHDFYCVSEDKAEKQWSVMVYERELDS